MNDSVMYTWDVRMSGSHGYGVIYRCVKKETADYLRDWCEAERENSFRNAATWLSKEDLGFVIQRERNITDKMFSVEESEVIL